MAIKLKGKLLLPPLILFAVALAFMGWQAYAVAREELRNAVLETLTAYSRALSFSLDDAAANIMQDLKGMTVIPPVMGILEIHNATDSPRYAALQQELDYSFATRTLVQDKTYAELDLTNAAGEIIASSLPTERHGITIERSAAYQRAMSSGKAQIGPPQSTVVGRCYVPFYAPVMRKDKAVGCIVALVDFVVLSERYVRRVQVESGYAIIVGPGGIIMDHPTTSLIMEPVDPDDPNDPSAIMHRQRQGRLEYQWNGSPWMAIFKTGAATNWTTVVKVDLHGLYQPIALVQRHIVGSSLFWLCAFAVIMILIGQRIVSALFETIDYARQVSGGALDQELTLRSNDEVGILADSLRSMVHSLQDMIAQSMAQQKELELISQHKTDFLANMSHEIRTPMNALTGFISLFRRDNLDEKQKNYLERISVASRAILQIINDVLDLSKIEKGKLLLENIPFSVRDTAAAIGGIMEFSAQSKGIQYTCRIDERVPALLLGDPNRLQQILFNLLGNAVKFTSKGGVRLEVHLLAQHPAPESSEGSAHVLFEIYDTGIGISQEQIDKLFSPFSQADVSITRKFGGTGLGLTISKRLVELMGGTISVQSALGQGSVFRFDVQLPLSDEESVQNPLVPAPTLSLPPQTRVLVVEDNEINQEVICALLEALGLTDTTVVSNGQEAIHMARDACFDIILMDMQMPIMDGVTATRHLRALGQEVPWLAAVPIVALTANALSSDVQRCQEAGMNAHISKPILIEVLRQVLTSQLGARKTHGAL